VHNTASAELKDKLAAFCAENKLVTTGGSDFHGMYSLPIKPLGSETVTEKEAVALIERKQKRRPSAAVKAEEAQA